MINYVGLGVRSDLEGYRRAKLSRRFIIKDRGILVADDLHEIRILNRVITYHPSKPGCPEMLSHEADQEHSDLLMAAYGLTASSKTKATPWDKAAFLARRPLAGPFLDEKRRVAFRSNSMRCMCSSLDRPDGHVSVPTCDYALLAVIKQVQTKCRRGCPRVQFGLHLDRVFVHFDGPILEEIERPNFSLNGSAPNTSDPFSGSCSRAYFCPSRSRVN